jgi:PLP dependent protein
VSIKENLETIYNTINKIDSPKKQDEIIVVAVSKTVESHRINECIDNGIRVIGENKSQELLNKYDKVNSGIKWHFIGHLQTNKVKYIIDKVELIHSVDSFKLAKEIDNQARRINKIMDILIQVNISGEVSKFGIEPQICQSLIAEISKLSNVRVKGLMTIPPFVGDKEGSRQHFKNMYKLLSELREKDIPRADLKYLSMGMSNDYDVAIEEGANIVRIGSMIFGKRL